MNSSIPQEELPPVRSLDETTRHRTEALMSLLQVHWFIRLRWAFVAAALAVLALERFITPAATRPGTLVIPVLLLAIVNLVWMGLEDRLLRQSRKQDKGQRGASVIRHALLFANAQVAVDLLLLTVILRYTGGVENPMALFYLFHMGIGALLLKPGHAILQGCWAMLLYSGLALGEWSGRISPHWSFLPQFPSPGLYARGEFIFAMLVVMACGVFAMLYFTLHITGRLYEREVQLRSMYGTLKRSEAAIFDLQQRRSRFLQTAAHQLKGPLASIETFVGLLADRIVPAEATFSTYEKIRQRCREGIQQVGELLTLARVQRADPRRHRRSMADVRSAVIEVCGSFQALAENKGLTLKSNVPTDDVSIAYVDPADLKDCISNLVDNAIKFSNGPGTVSITVTNGVPEFAGIEADKSPVTASLPTLEPCVAITVADTGIGMDSEMLAEARNPTGRGSIFDAFRRGNNALAAGIPGTGLGLAIVREAVEQAGGCIIVRSRKGQGSSFTITLPSREAPLEEPTIRETRTSLIVRDWQAGESDEIERSRTMTARGDKSKLISSTSAAASQSRP